MASILLEGSFLAGSLLTILIPVILLIVIAAWQTRAIMRVPDEPAAIHPTGAPEAEGRTDAADAAPRVTRG
jgi:hypothetical protein